MLQKKLTGANEFIKTKTVADWRKEKKPTFIKSRLYFYYKVKFYWGRIIKLPPHLRYIHFHPAMAMCRFFLTIMQPYIFYLQNFASLLRHCQQQQKK